MTIAAAVLIFFLLGCRDRDPAADAGATARVSAEDRALSIELAQEEKQLLDALEVTRAAARDPRTVELFEVGNQFDPDFEQIRANQKVAGYPIRRRRAISAEDATPLLQVLTTRSTYFEPGNGWMCIFEPHHVLRVVSGHQAVDVVICLKCGDVSHAANDRRLILKSIRPEANRKLASTIEALTSTEPVVQLGRCSRRQPLSCESQVRYSFARGCRG